MFYYLFYNSSFEFITNNRLFSTILYGSILYVITHAILNYCDVEILQIIKNYFWIILLLDIISFIWCIYNSLTTINNNISNNINPSSNNITNNNDNNLQVSFNLLKNKINTFLDKKNNLTITDTITINPGNPGNPGKIGRAHV